MVELRFSGEALFFYMPSTPVLGHFGAVVVGAFTAQVEAFRRAGGRLHAYGAPKPGASSASWMVGIGWMRWSLREQAVQWFQRIPMRDGVQTHQSG